MFNRGQADQESDVTIYLIVYYTSEFRRVTPDVEGHIEEFIALSNFAFSNSRIPLRLGLHCILEIDIDVEQEPSKERLRLFKERQGKSNQDRIQRNLEKL